MRAAIISSNLEAGLARLQPYRTLLQMGRELETRGHEIAFISDGHSRLPVHDEVLGLNVRRVPSVRLFRHRQNVDLLDAVDAESPHFVLWHLGVGSFAHQQLRHPFSGRTIAVVSSPAHGLGEILRSGPKLLASNVDLLATHLMGAGVPARLIRSAFGEDALDGAITFSEATRQYLIKRGAPPDRVWVVPPGIDQNWLDAALDEGERQRVRRKLGFKDEDFVVTYFGSPAPVRGLFTLIEAVNQIAVDYPQLRLLILSRRTPDRWVREAARLEKLTTANGHQQHIRVVDGYLDLPELIQHVAAGDAVSLPFELLPSDVPLSILEAMAVKQAVITTSVACIPELVENGRGFLTQPGSVKHLASQLREIVANPGAAQAHRQRAREYVENCRTWTNMGDILERVLLHVQDD